MLCPPQEAQLYGRAAALESIAAVFTQAMDRWSVGWFLVNLDAKVLLLNRTGRNIVERRDGVWISGGALCTDRIGSTRSLHHLIRAAITGPGQAIEAGEAIMVHRRSAKRPLAILVAPFQFQGRSLQQDKRFAMLFVTDSEMEVRSSPKIMQQLYGLTAAESRMADQLVQGKDMRMAAEELHVSIHTARDHVKHIFQKTGVCRQAELVRLLLTSVIQENSPHLGDDKGSWNL